ncbi:arginase family protein [Candidatus Pacearchaeota archaeon]|nr:arginase family protein [Candidatus Pacearchaeota archaeon]
MKLYSTNRINALGLKGPEKTPQEITKFTNHSIEQIILDNDNIQESQNLLYKKAKQIFNQNQKSVFIGGDHSITYPIFKAFQKTTHDPFLIIFDAHADCMPPSQEPTHEEFLRAIIEDGFPSEKIILIGARKIEPEEQEFLIKHNIKIFNEILNMETAADYITEKANNHNLYISIDIDALDPAFAPAVNYPEPAGLTSKEFFYILKRLLHIKSLKAIDIVEAVPQKDQNYDNRTLRTIAKIIDEAAKILK